MNSYIVATWCAMGGIIATIVNDRNNTTAFYIWVIGLVIIIGYVVMLQLGYLKTLLEFGRALHLLDPSPPPDPIPVVDDDDDGTNPASSSNRTPLLGSTPASLTLKPSRSSTRLTPSAPTLTPTPSASSAAVVPVFDPRTGLLNNAYEQLGLPQKIDPKHAQNEATKWF
jgi:hypothetical protein